VTNGLALPPVGRLLVSNHVEWLTRLAAMYVRLTGAKLAD
jgi:hypothetical protein